MTGSVSPGFRVPWFTLATAAAVLAVNAAAGALDGPPRDAVFEGWGFATFSLFNGNVFKLFSSALLTHGGWVFWRSWPLMIAILFVTERRLGFWRTALTFWVGHTLTVGVVSLAVVLPLHTAEVPGGALLYTARDVGPSAGYFCCLGVCLASGRCAGLTSAVFLGLAAVAGWHVAGLREQPAAVVADLAHLIAAVVGWFSVRPPAGAIASPTRRRWRRPVALAAAMAGVAVTSAGLGFAAHLVLPRGYEPVNAETLTIWVAEAPFGVPYYAPSRPQGLVVFGSGDGGWSGQEEKVAEHLVSRGYAVAAWDGRALADSRDYGADALIAGWAEAARAVGDAAAVPADAPVWYGGWSTGAQDAVAAAAGPGRAPHLVGLLLVAPDSRGRYGINASDLLGVTPEGEGSYSLVERGEHLGRVAVAQFAAGLDPMDSTRWLDTLAAPHRLFELDGMLHDMGGFGEAFQKDLDEAMAWSLEAHRAAAGPVDAGR